jgi:hypothetical protein
MFFAIIGSFYLFPREISRAESAAVGYVRYALFADSSL